MIHRFPRYLKGYVEFETQGKGIEKFLSYCNKNNINIFESHIENGALYAKCFVSDYKKLRNFPLNGMKRRIISKKGVRFSVHRYRKRCGILFGTLLMISVLIFLSGFVWKIEITGNSRISEDLIIQSLEECGFYQGVKKNAINVSEVENKMMQKLCDLSRIAINLDGSIAQIEIKEREMPPVMEDFSKPSNLIASLDGQILKMEIVKGKPIVKAGSGVVKGEILVSGHYLDKKENEIIEHSSGKITALVEINKTFKVQIQKNVVENIKDRITFSIILFDREYELGMRSNSTQYKTEKNYNLSLFGFDFPIILVKNTYYKQEISAKKFTKEQAKQEILMAIEHFESSDLYGGYVKEKEIVWSENSTGYKAKVYFKAIIDIAEQQYIDTNQKNQ